MTPDGSRARGATGYRLTLALILGLALAARLPMLGVASDSYRLAEALRGEEVENLRISTGMLHKHSLNPHAFEYPSLFYELSLLPETFTGVGQASWGAALEGVRVLSLVFGMITLLAVATLARRLAGDAAGLFAVSLAAFDRTLIEYSVTAKPNAAQVGLVMLAFLSLIGLASRPRVSAAIRAAIWLALATAAKWLGALGLAALALAPLLAFPGSGPSGLSRLFASIRTGLETRLRPATLFAPLIAFGLVLLVCVPYALLSPREFGFGLSQVLTAQGTHQRLLPAWMPLEFLWISLGPLGAAAAAVGLGWGAVRVLRWDGTPHDRGVLLVFGWAFAYGLLLMFAFVRLPGYLDLWVPFLAVLAGCAWVGEHGLLRTPPARVVAIGAVLAAAVVANGAHALARARLESEFDTRRAAGAWLAKSAADSDAVLADLGTFVPDRLRRVEWNAWGGPPRLIYDETRTWGSDPVWPNWTGGHRQLWFVNARWRPASERLSGHPEWVVVSDEWTAARARPAYVTEFADSGFDRALSDGSAGYTLRARFEREQPPSNPWRVLSLEKRSSDGPPWYNGPVVSIYQRTPPRERR